MMRKSLALQGAVVLFVAFGQTQAWGYGLGKVENPELSKTARRAANYLLAVELQQGGWAWQAESGQKSDNYGAIVAESLLAAYEQTGETRYLDSARRYAHELLGRYMAMPEALPYKPDVEFLVRMTDVSGEQVFARTAQAWFIRLKEVAPTGEMEVKRLISRRATTLDIVGYDVAQGVRAALAVGDVSYARELADAVLTLQSSWLSNPQSAFGTISRASLLSAFTLLEGEKYQKIAHTLEQELLSEQGKNGSWCTNGTQVTAYAVRALSSGSSTKANIGAKRGAQWLQQTALKRGAWAHYNDGMPEPFVGDVLSEVQAEALSAVIIAAQL